MRAFLNEWYNEVFQDAETPETNDAWTLRLHRRSLKLLGRRNLQSKAGQSDSRLLSSTRFRETREHWPHSSRGNGSESRTDQPAMMVNTWGEDSFLRQFPESALQQMRDKSPKRKTQNPRNSGLSPVNGNPETPQRYSRRRAQKVHAGAGEPKDCERATTWTKGN